MPFGIETANRNRLMKEHLQKLDASSDHALESMGSDRGRHGRSGSARSETFGCSQVAVLIGPAAPETGAVRFMETDPVRKLSRRRAIGILAASAGAAVSGAAFHTRAEEPDAQALTVNPAPKFELSPHL